MLAQVRQNQLLPHQLFLAQCSHLIAQPSQLQKLFNKWRDFFMWYFMGLHHILDTKSSQTTQCNNLHQMSGKPPASHEVIAPCRCAQALELTQMAKKGAHFRCPQHYCAVCRKSGDGVDMVKCIRCPTAYHSSCMPKDIQRLLPHAKVWPLLSPSTQICL